MHGRVLLRSRQVDRHQCIINTVLIEILSVSSDRIIICRAIERIITVVAYYIIDVAVIVKIAGYDTVPPAFRTIDIRIQHLEYSVIILEERNRHEFTCNDKVRPTIIIEISEKCIAG